MKHLNHEVALEGQQGRAPNLTQRALGASPAQLTYHRGITDEVKTDK